MKLRLRNHETRETLKLEFTDTATLRDLRRRINGSAPSYVHLSLNRKDELLASSPEDTLRSLGVTSGDLVYFSLDRSAFVSSVQEIGLASSIEAHQALDSPDVKAETLGPQSETSVEDSMVAEVGVVPDVDMNAKSDPNSGEEDQAIREDSGIEENPEPMDVAQLDVDLAAAESKRLSEPFFLKKVLMEKSGDTSILTTLALCVHAVILESGFVFDSASDKISLSKELLPVSLRYTLPELVTRKDTDSVESVTVKFQSLGHAVVVYGTLGESSGRVHRVSLDKRRFVPVIDFVMETLKSDKEGSSSIYRKVFMFWRMVKDGLVIPLLIGLCEKAGLELPPCLMLLPTELKMKILESLPGVSVAKMSCVCTEMRYLASDNDLWKQKCLEEANSLVTANVSDSINWKERFAAFWRQNQRRLPLVRRNFPMRRSTMRFPRIIGDPPFTWFNGDRLHGSLGINPGQPSRGLGGRSLGQSFSPRCNLGGLN